MAQVTEHGGGVWSIEVPIPDNPLGHTLVHVIETDSGPVLIDTGWDDPTSWDALTGGLAALSLSVADIHGVLITHHHPDHHGLSGQVREASGAWLAMHAADTEIVKRTRSAEPAVWLEYLTRKLAAAGAPDEHLAPLRRARAAGRIRTLPGLRAAIPDREIVPGDLLPLPGRRLRAIWTPGHTPGHVCLHLDEEHPANRPGNGRLFSGDHLLPGITPHIGLYEDRDDATAADPHPLSAPFEQGDPPPLSASFERGDPHPLSASFERGDPLGDYLDSLERIGRLAPAEVLPAHQYAFTDAASRVRELLAHHEDRLRDLLTLLAQPQTLWQIAERMEWNRPWEQIPHGSRNIAVSEAEAHLRRLVKLGQAEALTGSDPVTYMAV